jgi:hypothetical protein
MTVGRCGHSSTHSGSWLHSGVDSFGIALYGDYILFYVLGRNTALLIHDTLYKVRRDLRALRGGEDRRLRLSIVVAQVHQHHRRTT